ncbi:uncharacterized protein FOKN1_0791 [Thiohalobacter thiocyanaticus]|uniref:Uncharacterized protein n=1 Tax=Thiohalobacter thiocyanaticus TaxID=585455 RepID=A0A1Z4VNX3_9GAMM|nr:tetratricopeptide repeat-containing sulfotransferase family protein [Thiohalobacter thiocyanaticus]BAZ93193.1 uncharacterized protein FOKN1_0791 [Thiohalobacter thiocyanaticus]
MKLPQIKQKAQQLIQMGQPDRAKSLLEAHAEPGCTDSDIWFLLGLARGQTADPTGAEHAFRRCTKIRPDLFGAWDNLGISLLQQGRLDEAETCFATSIRLNASNPIPHLSLGQLHRARQTMTASEAALREALMLDPRNAAVRLELAITLRLQGQADAALAEVRAALKRNPGLAPAWHLQGELLHAKADFQGALEAFQGALRLQPLAETWCSLGRMMEELNRRDAARDSYQQALKLQPGNLHARVRLGVVLSGKGEFDSARAHLETTLKAEPAHPVATAELANILALQGDYTEAGQRLQPLLSGGDTSVDVARVYAEISPRLGQPEAALELLEQRLERTEETAPGLDGLFFAAGRLYERAGRYEAAFHHYQRAQTLRSLPDDIDRHLQEMDTIRAFFSAERLAALPDSGCDSQRPIFIVGMPRSGTSLVEQILASHPGVHGGGELTDLWQIVQQLPGNTGNKPYPACLEELTAQDLHGLARRYLDGLERLSAEAARVTDKLPHNFLHLGLVRLLLPQARVIHCVRDARDTCLSIYSHRFNTGHLYARNLHSLGRYYRAYERLMAHWEQVLDLPLLTLTYESLVEDTEAQSRRLVEFCGLDWTSACLRFYEQQRTVNTPSHAQVRQPVYTSAVQRWRRFEPWIGALNEGLGTVHNQD